MAETPSAWKIEKALAAWNDSRAQYIDVGDEESDEAFRSGTGDIKAILHKLARSAAHDSRMSDVCKSTMVEVRTRMSRFDAREAKKREIILQLMDILGIKSEDFGDVSVSMSPGVTSVVITNEAALSAEYVDEETVRTPKKREIRADLEQGVVIDGAYLSNPVPFITIRTK